MHKLIALYHQPRDPEQFKDHLVKTHLPLVEKMPGVRVNHYGFDLAATEGASPYFAVVEAEWDSEEAMLAAFESPEGEASSADVPNYATGGVTIFHYDTGG
jgi:uncharacterized protein (TIGR02118 family)